MLKKSLIFLFLAINIVSFSINDIWNLQDEIVRDSENLIYQRIALNLPQAHSFNYNEAPSLPVNGVLYTHLVHRFSLASLAVFSLLLLFLSLFAGLFYLLNHKSTRLLLLFFTTGALLLFTPVNSMFNVNSENLFYIAIVTLYILSYLNYIKRSNQVTLAILIIITLVSFYTNVYLIYLAFLLHFSFYIKYHKRKYNFYYSIFLFAATLFYLIVNFSHFNTFIPFTVDYTLVNIWNLNPNFLYIIFPFILVLLSSVIISTKPKIDQFNLLIAGSILLFMSFFIEDNYALIYTSFLLVILNLVQALDEFISTYRITTDTLFHLISIRKNALYVSGVIVVITIISLIFIPSKKINNPEQLIKSSKRETQFVDNLIKLFPPNTVFGISGKSDLLLKYPKTIFSDITGKYTNKKETPFIVFSNISEYKKINLEEKYAIIKFSNNKVLGLSRSDGHKAVNALKLIRKVYLNTKELN